MAPKGSLRKRLAASTDPPAGEYGTGSASSVSAGEESGLRGGIRRRLAATTVEEEHVETPLTDRLKKHWGKGTLSSNLVADIVDGAKTQGATNLPTLASSNHPQNLQRSLMAHFGKAKGSPDFWWHPVPSKKGRVMHPFLLPHLWIAALFLVPLVWNSAMVGPSGAASEYWEATKDSPFVQNHPHLDPTTWDNVIPLGMHGDAGSFAHHDSLFVFSMNSLLAAGSTRETRFVMTLVRKSLMTPTTMIEITKILSWSFNVALSGIDAVLSATGNPLPGPHRKLAGGCKAVLAQIRGDWQFYTEWMDFPKWNEKARMCWLCRATGEGPLSWNQFATDAPWRYTRVSHAQYLADRAANGKAVAAIFEGVVGLDISIVMVDSMHAVDLGVAGHIIGNICWLCVLFAVWGGRNQGESVAMLAEEYRVWCKKK